MMNNNNNKNTLECFLANVDQLFKHGVKLDFPQLSELATEYRCKAVAAQSDKQFSRAAKCFAKARQIESVLQLHETTRALDNRKDFIEYEPQRQAS